MQTVAESKNRFKETEVGLLPEDWELVQLGDKDFLELANGRRPEFVEGGNFPVFGANGVMGYSNQYLVDNDFTLVIGRVGASGEVHLAKGKVWISDNAIYSKAYPKSKVNMSFLYFMLKKIDLTRFATRTTHPLITQNFLKSFKIPLPQIYEQQKIALVLSKIQQAIEQQDKIIEATRNLKKSLMQKLFTEGIGHSEFKDSEIGQIPKSWEVVRLKDIATDFYGGGTPSTANKEYWGGGIPWMTSAFITGLYIKEGQRYITKKGLENSSTALIPRNNILIGSRVGTGKVAINQVDIAISQDLTGVIVDKQKVILEFLSYALLSQKVQEQIQSKNRGVTIRGITREDLKATLIPLAPLPEQAEISRSLRTLDDKIEAEEKRKATLQQLFKTMLHKLMTGEIRAKDLDLGGL